MPSFHFQAIRKPPPSENQKTLQFHTQAEQEKELGRGALPRLRPPLAGLQMILCTKYFLINEAALHPRRYQTEDSGLSKPAPC